MAQELDLDTYRLQNGLRIVDYTTEEFESLLRSFQGTLNREKEFTGGEEYEQLQSTFTLMESKFFDWRNNNNDETIKELRQSMMYFDDYSRFVASNHWDNERGDFYVFNENYHNFDEWRNVNVNEILDKDIEQIQANGGLSDAAMEADIVAQENPRPDYLDDKGNPHWFDEEEETEILSDEEIERLEKLNNENTNNSLEQSSLDKASELLKGMKFTSENYKKLLNVIKEISDLNGSENLQVPTEEEVKKSVNKPQPKKENAEVEVTPVESKEPAKKEKSIEQKEQFNPDSPIIFGKTVLPAFAVIVDGKLHSVENAVVKSFDKKNGNYNYIVDNGTEKLELPEKTFETLLKDKIEQEEKIKRAEGRTIVFEDKERGIKGTVIPEFAMYTQNGLESFKDFVPVKYNPADNSYTLSNGEKTLSVTGDKFKELTSNERFESKYDENSPAWKKLLEQQYKDYFEPRTNVAYNFRHNLSVFCRQHCNSPCDALHEAKNLISSMSKSEKKNTEELLKKIAHNGETTNEVIARIYHDAVKEQPLNEEYIKVNQPNNVIARPFYDTISKEGEKLDNDPALITGSSDHNLKIGSILKNVELNTEKLFGHGKDSLHFDELKVISASKEGNTITVMDSNKSFMKLPRDTVLEMYKENQLKEIKHEKKVEKQQSMSISYGY